ncbi:nuclear transport factor 2 family protein [Kitasatospora sp. RB6PN24]|uniref:nuclear transport factor 2 family protein n=1 Tax=Kitasatospora humi TaxID=2893891 RepID=UPI001E4EB98F|nr:nuclear transport factor 2 family protein [Kitasatospora humi]MCC9307353.1 nuclear transport factor 2 family protein [Kitasatospora humi]
MSKIEIDAITAEFFGAFDNRGGRSADVDRIRRLMLPGGVIVVTRPSYTVYTVEEFIAPRELLLSDGRLVEFSEWETSERTDIVGDLATRTSEYQKSGLFNGEPYEGTGTQTFQFVRTPDGWRIASSAWFDHP